MPNRSTIDNDSKQNAVDLDNHTNNSINNDVVTPLLALDEEGHLVDHQLWTTEVAQQLADTLEVTLTATHMKILHTVRQFHSEFNHPPATRPLIKYLINTLPDENITNQRLQQLFKTGLVARHVNRIAGLPKPPNCL